MLCRLEGRSKPLNLEIFQIQPVFLARGKSSTTKVQPTSLTILWKKSMACDMYIFSRQSGNISELKTVKLLHFFSSPSCSQGPKFLECCRRHLVPKIEGRCFSIHTLFQRCPVLCDCTCLCRDCLHWHETRAVCTRPRNGKCSTGCYSG